MMKTRKFGWIPDVGDARDFVYSVTAPKKLPKTFDLRDKCPPVWDQFNTGSCTAQSVGGMMAFHSPFNSAVALKNKWKPSRLFLYYNTRVIEHTVDSDAGAQIRNSIKSAAKYGAPKEPLWPYKEAKFAIKPSDAAYENVSKAVNYQRIPRSVSAMRTCLASGNPFVFGFSVYENIERVGKDGILTMPDLSTQMLGGHAVMAVGYTENTFIVRNSWGARWANKGYFTMPLAYLMDENLSDDFWVIRSVAT